jgi:hypothetical protein
LRVGTLEGSRRMQIQKTLSDVEDDNIWRLVAKDPERLHHNVAPGSRVSDYSTQSSRRQVLDHQKSQSSSLSNPKKSRTCHLVAAGVGVLGAISCLVAGVYISVRVKPQQHQPQQRASPRSQSLSLSISSTNSPIVDAAPKTEAKSLASAPSGGTPFLRSPAEVSPTFSEGTIHQVEEGVLSTLKGFKSMWQHPRATDTPVLLNIGYELSGAKPIKDILWTCHHLTLAGENARSILKEYPQDKVRLYECCDFIVLIKTCTSRKNLR